MGTQAQYCDAGNTGCIVVARVVLGHPAIAVGPMLNADKPPDVPGLGIPHDSTIVKPGTPNGKGKGETKGKGKDKNKSKALQMHWEFVVPRGDLQVYPEYLIKFQYP